MLALGHGAGGGVDAPDLLAAQQAALELGWRVARIEQPWRLRGAKVAEAPPRLDRAWLDVLTRMRATTLVVGGRSAGARVACRTATELGAAGVLCLAFPLHPPGRPDRSRLPELELPVVPVLVVQGDRDAFGVPDSSLVIPGADHSLKKGVPLIRAAVRDFLQALT